MVVTAMTEDIDIVPFKEVVKKKDPPEMSDIPFFPKRRVNSPRETRMPDEQAELPVSEWIMPDQPQGYIKGRDYDIL
jgi:hypothetical protein